MNTRRSTWIGLIRGIGPTTHKLMSMKQLAAACRDAGWSDARTILATGNVIFSAAGAGSRIRKTLAGIIASHDLKNEVFLRQPGDLSAVLTRNPFPDAAAERPNHMLVLFLERAVDESELAALREHEGPERVAASSREVFIDYVEGVGRSKMTPALLERRLGQPGTARNWNTVQRLLAAASS